MNKPVVVVAAFILLFLVLLVEYLRRRLKDQSVRSTLLEEELEATRAEVRSSEKFRNEIMVKVSEEIRAPLLSLKTKGEMLIQPFLSDEERVSGYKKICDDMKQLDIYLDCLGEILELHTMDESSEEPPLKKSGEKILLEDIMADILHHAGSNLGNRGLSLTVSSDTGLIIQGNPAFIRKAVTSLLEETTNLLRKGSLIHVDLARVKGYARLTIDYHGELESEAESSALVLALIRQILHSHGGFLRAGSKPGSFMIFLELESAGN